MKKFNRIFWGIMLAYSVLAAAAYMIMHDAGERNSRQYLVEVNEIMKGLEMTEGFFSPDLHSMTSVRAVTYLPLEDITDTAKTEKFYMAGNGYDMQIEPLIQNGNMLGYVKFEYQRTENGGNRMLLAESFIIGAGLLLAGVLLYIKISILKPFFVLRNMPYELSKGHLSYELPENQNRFFGKFVWGITMLRDTLKASKTRELKLEKEKKLLLLSISHDIKTPLNTIKLYAKALAEDIYTLEGQKKQAAEQIGYLALEIEDFVKEIVRTSSEDILTVEVEKAEFYLKDLIEMVKAYYVSKCQLLMTDLIIGPYDNKLLKGNLDSAFEVMENLLENALKYGDGKSIRINFGEEEYCQLIEVVNTGRGVGAQEMPHLFDSFFRGSNAGDKDGNGLGLYICRQIMKKMDGDIFAGQLEDGMCFTLVFR